MDSLVVHVPHGLRGLLEDKYSVFFRVLSDGRGVVEVGDEVFICLRVDPGALPEYSPEDVVVDEGLAEFILRMCWTYIDRERGLVLRTLFPHLFGGGESPSTPPHNVPRL